MGRQQYIQDAERDLCLNLQKKKNDPNFNASLNIPDDPEMTVFGENEVVLTQEPQRPVMKKLNFAEADAPLANVEQDDEDDLQEFDGDEVERLLTTSTDQDVVEAANLNLELSDIPVDEVMFLKISFHKNKLKDSC